MKKRISLFVMFVILLSTVMTSFTVFGYTDNPEETYHTCDEILENIEEKIDNYFLPAAYDISPYTVRYGGYLEYPGYFTSAENKYVDFDCHTFYEDEVIYDDRGRISVPPVHTLIVDRALYDCHQEMYFTYTIFMDYNKNGVEMTPAMWRALNNNYDRTGVSVESAIDAFIAPWTLYNKGELYTWIDIMAMSESELEQLDFNSYDFSKFIKNVKVELVIRGWWREEYSQKYDLLYAHKDDYHNSQSNNEIMIIDGEFVYLERINSEYQRGEKKILDNIISVNIYKEEFKEAVASLEDDVYEKYSQVLNAIKEEWEENRRDSDIEFGDENYLEAIESCGPPGESACTTWLYLLQFFVEEDTSHIPNQDMRIFSIIEELDLSEEEIRDIFERFNYIMSTDGAFNFEMIDNIVNNTKKENVDYFAYGTSVVLSYDNINVIPWWRAAALSWSSGELDDMLNSIDDYERVIARLEYLYNNKNSSRYKDTFKSNIDYLRDYAKMPDTGDNTVLYIIIAGAAVVAMISLSIRRKREVIS